jgi:hypothetical protein
MVNVLTIETQKMWVNSIVDWLQKPTPSNSEFEKLTKRFTLDAMLQQWVNVIEG